ncbi:MAG: cell division protein ZipA C-terminal FtsZ-binding domain-containing protein [Litorivicinaceae bacterium]
MEFGLREYLLILGGVLIVGLLVDGIRRTLKHRRQGLKLDLMAAPPELPEYAEVSAPRPAKRAMTPQSLEPEIHHDPLFHDDEQGQLALWSVEIKSSTVKAKVDPGAILETPSQTPEVLGTPVQETAARVEPVFEEPLFADSGPVALDPEGTTGSNAWLPDESVPADAEGTEERGAVGSIEPESLETTSWTAEHADETAPSDETVDQHATDMAILADASTHVIQTEAEKSTGGVSMVISRLFQKFSSRAPMDEPLPTPSFDDGVVSPARPVARTAEQQRSGESQTASAESRSEDEVTLDDLVIIRIRAARAEHFAALDLHTACLRAGLRFTTDQVYSRYPLDDSQPPLFTLVNGIEPGVFDEEARAIETPLLVLFSVLKEQSDPVFAVTEMVTGARSIARTIAGEVLDDQDQPITREWIDLARARAGHSSLAR